MTDYPVLPVSAMRGCRLRRAKPEAFGAFPPHGPLRLRASPARSSVHPACPAGLLPDASPLALEVIEEGRIRAGLDDFVLEIRKQLVNPLSQSPPVLRIRRLAKGRTAARRDDVERPCLSLRVGHCAYPFGSSREVRTRSLRARPHHHVDPDRVTDRHDAGGGGTAPSRADCSPHASAHWPHHPHASVVE